MNYVQLFAQKQGETGYASYVELDLYPQDPIKLTKGVQSVEDPTVNRSSFTRNFRVPNTNTNGQYFEAVFNVNSLNYNSTITANSYILVDGQLFISGNLRLDNIYRNDSTGKVEYELIFIGETGNFGTIVAPRDLSALDLSEYNHAQSYQNIKNSWTYSLFGGDIVYPLAEWGYTYSTSASVQPTVSTLSYYDGVNSIKGFTNVINPLSIEQFKPAIRMKALWDKIFEEAGFTYESQFLNSTTFTNLYFVSTKDASAILPNTVGFQVANTFPQSLPIGSGIWTKMDLNSEFYDNGNSFDPATSTYTIPYTFGPYYFTFDNFYVNATETIGSTGSFQIAMYVNGVQVQVRSAYVTPGGLVQTLSGLTTIEFNYYFNEGDVVDFRIYVPAFDFITFGISSVILTNTSSGIVDMGAILPGQYKQIDIIKGINDRFKLIWEVDQNNPTKFYIEPWVTWIQNGREIDWTDKLDEDKDLTIKPLFYTQARELIFKDSPESDVFNKSYQDEFKETFGELKQDSNIQLIKGQKVIQSLFASTPLAPIGNATEFLIPKFSKLEGIQFQPIQVKPRMLYYNGLVSAPFTWYMNNDAVISTPQTTYPAFSQFDRYPYDSFASDLNWTNNQQFWNPIDVGFSGRTSRTAFSEYWSTWFDSTYDPYSRILEGNFVLDSTDIQNIRFNDLIYVKDSWWLPIEIKDYVLGSKSSAKVSLLKLGAVGVNIGSTGGASIGTRYFEQSGLCYDPTDGCKACCCESLTGVTVFTENEDLLISGRFFANAAGTANAPAGYYSDGTYTYIVNSVGQVTALGLCSTCNCGPAGPTTFFDDVCSGVTLCEVCCCTSHDGSLYGNGGSLETSSQLWPTATGGSLTPGYWYGATGGNAVQIGADGNSVVTVGLCSSCICDFLTDDNTVGQGLSSLAACCGQGVTGSQGYSTVYYNDPVFNSATEFYYDPFENIPAGGTGTSFISDGEYFKEITGATATDGGNCSPSTCPNRDKTVFFDYVNNEGTATEIRGTYYISYDSTNYIMNGSDIESGSSFSVTNTAEYTDDESQMKVSVNIPIPYSGFLQVTLTGDGNEIYSSDVISTPIVFESPGIQVLSTVTNYTWTLEWFL